MIKRLRALSRPRRIRLALALVVALAGLALLLGGFTRQVVALPLAYAWWIASQLLKSVPQIFLWIWLLIMLVVLGLVSFNRPARPAEYSAGQRRQKQKRIAFWALQVSIAQRGAYYRSRFAEFLGKVIWGVMGYARRSSAAQAERDFRSGRLELPVELAPFVLTRSLQDEQPPSGWRNWLAARVSWPARRNRRSSARRDRDLERAITYLEQQLEVKHEHRNP